MSNLIAAPEKFNEQVNSFTDDIEVISKLKMIPYSVSCLTHLHLSAHSVAAMKMGKEDIEDIVSCFRAYIYAYMDNKSVEDVVKSD